MAETFELKRRIVARPNVGIVRVRTTGYNQDGVTVIEFERAIMIYRRDGAPR